MNLIKAVEVEKYQKFPLKNSTDNTVLFPKPQKFSSNKVLVKEAQRSSDLPEASWAPLKTFCVSKDIKGGCMLRRQTFRQAIKMAD